MLRIGIRFPMNSLLLPDQGGGHDREEVKEDADHHVCPAERLSAVDEAL